MIDTISAPSCSITCNKYENRKKTFALNIHPLKSVLKLYYLTNETFLNCILEVKQTVFVVKIYATLSQKYLSLYLVQIISKYLVLSSGQNCNLGVQCFYNPR